VGTVHGVAAPPVLCYHRIAGPPELGVTRIGRSVFARQMRALAEAGWRTLTLAEFAAAVRRTPHAPLPHAPTPSKVFLLTFDDGYASLGDHAYPLLAELGFTATTFLITDHVGRTNTWDVRYTWRRLAHLDWPAIEAWRARGFDFASHSASHVRLTWLADAPAAAELARSRETLCARLGEAAGRAVAYPFGASDARIERLAAAAGYELGFGGVRGGRGRGRGGNGNTLNVARVPVYVWDMGSRPLGLRGDRLGALGILVADLANRCAVGTSLMLTLRRQTSDIRG